MREFLDRAAASFGAWVAVALGIWVVLSYARAKREQQRFEFEKRMALEASSPQQAMRAGEKARDAAQRVNYIKNNYIARRDALKKAGNHQAAEILERLNRHVR